MLDWFRQRLAGTTSSDSGYRLRRSTRAKRARLVVYADRIEVVAPAAMPIDQIDAFVARHRSWIQAKKTELALRVAAAPATPSWDDGLPFLGEHFPFAIHERSGQSGAKVTFERQFTVTVPPGLNEAERGQLARHNLEAWYRRRTAEHARQWVERHAPRYGLFPRTIAVRGQKTRWGSCGPQGDINLNWRLILAPPQALEYVVVHELCHLRHRNHAPAFWQLVADHLPHYQEQRRWLKDNGPHLFRVLAT